MTKWGIAPWWKYVFGILMMVTLITALAYAIGAGGFRARGAAVTLDRSADYLLFRVNDEAAIYYKPSNNSMSLATYRPAFPAFRIFGEYEMSDEIFNGPVAKNGDWFYNPKPQYYEPGRIIGYNARTKEKILKKTKAEQQVPNVTEFREKGFPANPAEQIKPQDLAKFPQLSVPKESAIVTGGALIAATILWLMILPFAVRKYQVQ